MFYLLIGLKPNSAASKACITTHLTESLSSTLFAGRSDTTATAIGSNHLSPSRYETAEEQLDETVA